MSGLLSDPNAVSDDRRRLPGRPLGRSLLDELNDELAFSAPSPTALPPLPIRPGQSLTMPSDRFTPIQPPGPLRPLGLGVRGVVEGSLSLPAMLGDVVAYPVNRLYDALRAPPTLLDMTTEPERPPLLPPQGQAVAQILDRLGLPRPENRQERITDRVVRDVAGGATLYGLGGPLRSVANEVGAMIGRALTTDPAGQVTGAVASGLAGGAAREVAPNSDAADFAASFLAGIPASAIPLLLQRLRNSLTNPFARALTHDEGAAVADTQPRPAVLPEGAAGDVPPGTPAVAADARAVRPRAIHPEGGDGDAQPPASVAAPEPARPATQVADDLPASAAPAAAANDAEPAGRPRSARASDGTARPIPHDGGSRQGLPAAGAAAPESAAVPRAVDPLPAAVANDAEPAGRPQSSRAADGPARPIPRDGGSGQDLPPAGAAAPEPAALPRAVDPGPAAARAGASATAQFAAGRSPPPAPRHAGSRESAGPGASSPPQAPMPMADPAPQAGMPPEALAAGPAAQATAVPSGSPVPPAGAAVSGSPPAGQASATPAGPSASPQRAATSVSSTAPQATAPPSTPPTPLHSTPPASSATPLPAAAPVGSPASAVPAASLAGSLPPSPLTAPGIITALLGSARRRMSAARAAAILRAPTGPGIHYPLLSGKARDQAERDAAALLLDRKQEVRVPARQRPAPPQGPGHLRLPAPDDLPPVPQVMGHRLDAARIGNFGPEHRLPHAGHPGGRGDLGVLEPHVNDVVRHMADSLDPVVVRLARGEEVAGATPAQLRAAQLAEQFNMEPLREAIIRLGVPRGRASRVLFDTIGFPAATSPRTRTDASFLSGALYRSRLSLDPDIGADFMRRLLGRNSGFNIMYGTHSPSVGKLIDGSWTLSHDPKLSTYRSALSGDWSAAPIDINIVRAINMSFNDILPGILPRASFVTDAAYGIYKRAYQRGGAGLRDAAMRRLLVRAPRAQIIDGTRVPSEYIFYHDIVTGIAERLRLSPARTHALLWFHFGSRTGLASPRTTPIEYVNGRFARGAGVLRRPVPDVAEGFIFNRHQLSIAGGMAGAGTLGGLLDAERGERRPSS